MIPRLTVSDSIKLPSAALQDPIRDLESSIAPLLVDLERREDALATLDPERRSVFADALRHASDLYQWTHWSPEELLRRLGCRITPTVLPDLNRDRLERCRHFLELVAGLVCLVDTLRDRRAIVMECVDLLDDKQQDSHALEEAFYGGPKLTGADYLRLGEVAKGALTARGRAGFAVKEQLPHGRWAVHLSVPRIDALIVQDTDRLGPDVTGRMHEHIAVCGGCQRAQQARLEVLRQSENALASP